MIKTYFCLFSRSTSARNFPSRSPKQNINEKISNCVRVVRVFQSKKLGGGKIVKKSPGGDPPILEIPEVWSYVICDVC